MRIKITYNPETLVVEEFSCLPNDKATMDKLKENQKYVDGTSVPMSFYRDFYNYSFVDGKLVWDSIFYFSLLSGIESLNLR